MKWITTIVDLNSPCSPRLGDTCAVALLHRLYVLRHVKSSWDDTYLRDDERPLSDRGRTATAALTRHFANVGVAVDLVLCSPARRTRETWAGVAGGVSGSPAVRFEPLIYEATSTSLLHLLRQVDETVGAVLLIGHNPAMEDLTHRLAGHADRDALERLKIKFPTGAFATFNVSNAWSDLAWGSAFLADFVVPRDLD